MLVPVLFLPVSNVLSFSLSLSLAPRPHYSPTSQRHKTDFVYLCLVVTSTMALIAMLASSYSCKFAKVTEMKRSTELLVTEAHGVPSYFGIWQVMGTPQESEFYDDIAEYQCISWGNTMWDQAGSIRASKIYSLTATVVGLALWAFILWGSCRTMNSNMIFALCSVSLVCEALSALYFEVLGAEPCFQYGYQCHWDMGAYYAAAAVLLWMFTAIGFALYQPKLVPVDDDENRNENGQGNGTTGDNHNNTGDNNTNNNATTDGTDLEQGVVVVNATTDASSSPQSSDDASSENEESGLGKKKKSSRLGGDTDVESISTADTPFNLSFDDDDVDDEDDDDSGDDIESEKEDKEMDTKDKHKD